MRKFKNYPLMGSYPLSPKALKKDTPFISAKRARFEARLFRIEQQYLGEKNNQGEGNGCSGEDDKSNAIDKDQLD